MNAARGRTGRAQQVKLVAALSRRIMGYAWSKAAIQLGLDPAAPSVLELGITNACNLRCEFCFFTLDDAPTKDTKIKDSGYMAFEMFEDIMSQAAGWITHLSLDLFGEPMLHPRFMDMIELAVGKGLQVQIFTNGTLLSKQKARELVELRPASIVFSLEGESAEKNEQLRTGSHSSHVEANLRYLIEHRRAQGQSAPSVLVNGVALEEFKGQREQHRARFIAMGVDGILWTPEDNWDGQLVRINGSAAPLPNRTEQCETPWTSLVIDWDGTVVKCCQDYARRGVVGHVRDESLRAIWRGERIRRLREVLRTRDRARIDAEACSGNCSTLCDGSGQGGWDLAEQRLSHAIHEIRGLRR